MSILNAKPFINEVLKSCSEAELDTLLICINGQGPKAVFRTLKPYAEDRLTEADKGVKPIVLELPDSRAQTVYNGYLIYTNEHCVALTYGNNKEQNLLIINIDNDNGNYEILNGDLSITELRSTMEDETKASLVNGKVPASQLPSYVDDVIEGYFYDSKFYSDAEHTTEIEGETGKIYVDLATGFTYRWSGSMFVQIGGGESGVIEIDANTTLTDFQELIGYNNTYTSSNPIIVMVKYRTQLIECMAWYAGGFSCRYRYVGTSQLLSPKYPEFVTSVAAGFQFIGDVYPNNNLVMIPEPSTAGTYLTYHRNFMQQNVMEWESGVLAPALPNDASSKTYVLKAVNGTLTWVEEAAQ